MIDKLDPNQCVGCSVCHDICPTGAITMEANEEGFKYPHINLESCIHCNLCEKNCPVLQKESIPLHDLLPEVKCFAAQHKSYPVRFDSTSGGVFSALASVVYKRGGYVGGAVRTEDGYVEHFISNKRKDLLQLRQSKYTQSYTEGIYKKIKELLQDNQEVLICGTPCQMAGLRLFLKKDYPKLYIIDFICNNVFSPAIWNGVKKHVEKQYGAPLTYTKFKDKELGWRNRSSRYDFANGKTVYSSVKEHNIFDHIYHHHVAARPSCYTCPFKGYPRYADLSFADFWGCEKHHPRLDDNIGTSAVICTTSKGLQIFNDAAKVLNVEDSKLDWIQKYNPSLVNPCTAPKCDRHSFFKDVLEGVPLDKACEKHFDSKNVILKKIKSHLKTMGSSLGKFYKGLRMTQWNPRALSQFFYYNFLSRRVVRSKGCYLMLAPLTYIQINKKAKLILDGSFILGKHKLKKARAHSDLFLDQSARLHVKKLAYFMYGSSIHVFRNAFLEMGEVRTNTQVSIVCGSHIKLGNGCMIGRNVNIRDENAHVIAIEGYKVKAPVDIGDHTWLCSECTVSAGTQIGTGSVISSCSLVSGKVPAHSLVSGNPGKIIMKNIAWKF